MAIFKESPYNDITQQIIDRVNCNYKVFSKSCTIEQVNEIYLEEFERGKKEGFFPVLVPCDDVLAEWLDISDEDKEDIINSVGDNGEEILKKRYNLYGYDETLEEYMEDMEPINMLSAFSSYTSEGIEETILFEIPVDKPWKVIGWIPMGGWNECPAPDEMITICRYWYEKYGAVPAVITHDVMEFLVEKPVTSKRGSNKTC